MKACFAPTTLLSHLPGLGASGHKRGKGVTDLPLFTKVEVFTSHQNPHLEQEGIGYSVSPV